jgi:predicted kinase
MTKVIITVGISCSGKSTFADEEYKKNPTKVRIVCRDWIRHRILIDRTLNDGLKGYNRGCNPTNIWKVWKFGKDENLVSQNWWEEFASGVKSNYETIICADTNLNQNRLNAMIDKMVSDYGIARDDITIKVFDITLEEAWKRDAARPDGVGHQVLYNQWMQYQVNKKYVPVAGTRKAIMVDLDGTLAHMNGRGAFEWLRVDEDTLDPAVYAIVRGFYMQGYEIVIMSGRDSVSRVKTEEWLEKHNVPYAAMFMRSAQDMRKDSVVKNELFWDCVAPYYNVECVIDDRPQVVRQWQSLGLKVIIVGNPWQEF